MSVWITICDTCKRDDWPQRGMEKTDGEMLGALVKARLKAIGAKGDGLLVRHHSCLMACARACSVSVQAEGKLSYMLGKFEPCTKAAEAIIEYARAYDKSASGQVPFKLWPEGVKGHFLARLPALPQSNAKK